MVNTRLHGATLQKANKLLRDLIDYLNENNIDYHLEGGTLLGFVRDGGFLEWDHDIDISIPSDFTEKFYSKRRSLWLKGYRITRHRSKINYGPISRGSVRIFKVKGAFYSFFRMFSNRLKRNELVADVFIKFQDGSDVFWISKGKIMSAPSLHYNGFSKLNFKGLELRIPAEHKDYLTHKYGDWSLPVKEWDCAVDEKSVIADAI